MPTDFLWQLAGATGPWAAFLALLAYVLQSHRAEKDEMRAAFKVQMDLALKREDDMRASIKTERDIANKREESILARLEQTTSTFDRACEVHRQVASNLPRLEASIQKLSETVDKWIDRERVAK